MAELFMEKKEDDGTPFWSEISKAVSQGSKKFSFKLTYQQIIKLIESNRWPCDMCGKELEIKFKLTPLEIFVRLCNPYTYLTCDQCMWRDFEKGNVIAAQEGFLDDISQIRKQQNQPSDANG